MVNRPTKDPKMVALDSFDGLWAGLVERLEGLTDEEYLWAPVEGWTVAAGADGIVRVTGSGHEEPGPFTTIAWRLWHIAIDCLDGYSERLFDTVGSQTTGDHWHLDVASARADLDRAWRNFRDNLEALDGEGWWAQLGDDWGPFGQHSVHDLVLHAHHEVSHHAGEVGVLRDLWRAGVR